MPIPDLVVRYRATPGATAGVVAGPGGLATIDAGGRNEAVARRPLVGKALNRTDHFLLVSSVSYTRSRVQKPVDPDRPSLRPWCTRCYVSGRHQSFTFCGFRLRFLAWSSFFALLSSLRVRFCPLRTRCSLSTSRNPEETEVNRRVGPIGSLSRAKRVKFSIFPCETSLVNDLGSRKSKFRTTVGVGVASGLVPRRCARHEGGTRV